ncbi:MAG TPA: hypothetical protein PLA94_00820, partial [Myxococcota bacterium]|nr:hypothetical protein [Myxococcota bacterium]
ELRQLVARPRLQLLDAEGRPLQAEARLDFTGSAVDPRLGTVPMRAELPNADGALLPGQTVRVQLQLGAQSGFLLPQAAVLNGEQGRFVWLMKDGKALPQPVQTGGWQGEQWVIRAGLSAGDAVITDPTNLNSTVKLKGPATTEPSVCTENEYTFRLTVTDCTGESDSDTISILVNCCGVLDSSN